MAHSMLIVWLFCSARRCRFRRRLPSHIRILRILSENIFSRYVQVISIEAQKCVYIKIHHRWCSCRFCCCECVSWEHNMRIEWIANTYKPKWVQEAPGRRSSRKVANKTTDQTDIRCDTIWYESTATEKGNGICGWQMNSEETEIKTNKKKRTEKEKKKHKTKSNESEREIGKSKRLAESSTKYSKFTHKPYRGRKYALYIHLLYGSTNINANKSRENMCLTILVPFGTFSLEPFHIFHKHRPCLLDTHIAYYTIILLLYY